MSKSKKSKAWRTEQRRKAELDAKNRKLKRLSKKPKAP